MTGSLEALDRATRLNPNDFETWCEKTQTLLELKRYQEALEAADRAISIGQGHPDIAIAWIAKAAVLKEMGREEEALALGLVGFLGAAAQQEWENRPWWRKLF